MVDVAVVGDGPAGSALAAALARCGVGVVLVGRDEPWHATYGTWIDDLDGIDLVADVDLWAHVVSSIEIVGDTRRVIERAYGVVDNAALRTALRAGVDHVRADVVGIEHAQRSRIALADADPIEALVVVDATGWPGRFVEPAPGAGALAAVPRQTALGVVLPEPPDGPLGRATLMDWTPTTSSAGDGLVPSFAYALPLADGWLVEETVLAARPGVDPDRLLPRLADRLATTPDDLLERATRVGRVERVDIPMGGPLPDRSSRTLAFGAAASMIHPATGYSLAASLRRAEPVAAAIAAAITGDGSTWDAIWPASMRRARALHDYGLDVLLALDANAIAAFFGAFFDLDRERWSRYLRIDTPPTEIAATMAAVFASADWRLRRRLVSANPRAFVRLLRP